jgi:hypothetical protein
MAHSEAGGERAVTRECGEGASRVRKPKRKPKQTYSRAMTSDLASGEGERPPAPAHSGLDQGAAGAATWSGHRSASPRRR